MQQVRFENIELVLNIHFKQNYIVIIIIQIHLQVVLDL